MWEGEVGGVQRCCVGGRGRRSAEVLCGRERWEEYGGVVWEGEVGGVRRCGVERWQECGGVVWERWEEEGGKRYIVNGKEDYRIIYLCLQLLQPQCLQVKQPNL